MEELFTRNGLPNIFGRLAKGGDVTVAYLGGSITRAEGYRVMTAQWLEEQYPAARIRAINAGVSGTGSDLGCARLEMQVLQHKPDLVTVEFVVNDGGDPESKARVEGIVRQIRKASPQTDILFLYTLAERDVAEFQAGRYQKGASLQEEVADYYGIPSIHLGVEVSRRAGEGSLIFTAPQGAEAKAGAIVFTHDSIHPTVPDGHRIYADTIIRHLETLRSTQSEPSRSLSRNGAPVEHSLPEEPLVPGNPWEYAAMAPPAELARFDDRWRFETPADFALAREYDWLFPGLWRAEESGAAFTVEFTGTRLGLFDIGGPDSGRLKVTVDGGEPFIIERFTRYNDHNRNEYVFLPELPNGRHSVRFEIDAGKTDKAQVFQAAGNTAGLEHMRAFPEEYARSVIQLGMLLTVCPPLAE
ncbi:SGNH/GDSL hydrolase family protein [Paenibacillus sp. YN15]|uniref:SGNH/GDSL hydrolase family protein n=1 Tax=Paenibacillus sp. YN15 TaxID=1742774 RepID=UPI000DCDF16D|nr:SGNH/GDSL hydrolase family protein [Paenibacillus sp. YN15]RAV04667.1 hypothetical protein DQG13_05495 [Paenibacillus sp. YN15]